MGAIPHTKCWSKKRSCNSPGVYGWVAMATGLRTTVKTVDHQPIPAAFRMLLSGHF
jgi:hypothetical protein